MARLLSFATITAVLACAAHAQQPNVPAHKTMVLTGCLRPAPDKLIFKLTDATLEAPVTGLLAAASPAGPVGTVGKISEVELTTDNGVDLSGTEKVELNRYVDRRVQITARPPEIAPSSPSNSPASTTSAGPEPKVDEQKPPRLIVTAIKQLSSSCQ
jgi:hypothetical protein